MHHIHKSAVELKPVFLSTQHPKPSQQATGAPAIADRDYEGEGEIRRLQSPGPEGPIEPTFVALD